MPFYLRGSLCGRLCEGYTQHFPAVVIRLYRPTSGQGLSEAVAAELKNTLRVLDEKGIDAKSKLLLAEAKTNADGQFELTIDEKQQEYAGGPLELDLYFPEIPDLGQGPRRKKFTPFQVSLTTLQPRWQQVNAGYASVWKECIQERITCYLLSLLDLWVICGEVSICETKTPLPGIEVIAMDNDWITDDQLGAALTNEAGQFRMWYHSDAFKQTFLSPVLNVETPFPPFNSGPDVYFRLRRNGSQFWAEAPRDARDNVSNCLCVRLCVPDSLDIPGPEDETYPTAAFLEIGNARRYHILNHISPTTGKTANKPSAGLNDLAFYSTLALMGSLAKTFNGKPMQYLFEMREYVLSAGGVFSPAPSATWTQLTPGQINHSVIGYREETTPDPENPILNTNYAIQPAPGEEEVFFDGNWVRVPQDPRFWPNVNGLLLCVDTTTIMNEVINMAGLVQGNSTTMIQSTTTIQPLPRNRYIRLRMRKRGEGDTISVIAGTTRPFALSNFTYQNVAQGGGWLPTTENARGVGCLDLVQLSGSGCADIIDQIEATYTAAHPNLGQVRLIMNGPGGPHAFTPASPLPQNVAGQEAFGTATYAGSVPDLPDCAYVVRLYVETKITNGEDQPSDLEDALAFCKADTLSQG